MANKIFAKNIKSPESLQRFNRLFCKSESAYSNTISDILWVRQAVCQTMTSHFLLSLPIFYIWDVKWPEAAGTGRLFYIPDDRQSVNMLIRLRLIRVCTIFPNLFANI